MLPFNFKDLLEILQDKELTDEFIEMVGSWYWEIITDFFFTIFRVFTFQRTLWNGKLFPTVFYGISWWSIVIAYITS